MKIVVFTGAGMSQESGISTFRDANGLWEKHDIMDVASPEGFQKNPDLVLEFYNQRRRQLKEVQPNIGHLAIAELEKEHEVTVITQNVDDLHERAGSSNVVHLHGELRKVRSVKDESDILYWENDLNSNDRNEKGHALRPHIVWFGEAVPMMDKAIEITSKADVFVAVGTSLQVYPAANLMDYAPGKRYYIDASPASVSTEIETIQAKASEGLQLLKEKFLK